MAQLTNNYLIPQGTLFVGLNGGSGLVAVTPTAVGQVLKYDPTQTGGVAFEREGTFPNATVTYPTGTYSVALTDQLVYASSSAAHTITLPTAPPEGWSVWIKDVTGTAGTNTITVTAAVNIDGASSYAMTTSYGYTRFVYSATNTLWYTI